MMKDQCEAIRRLITQMMEALDTDPTGLARRAGVAPSTITRFMNSDDPKNLPTMRTMIAASQASGIPLFGGIGFVAPQTKPLSKQELLEELARALGVDLPQDLSARELELLAGFRQLPDGSQQAAVELLRGWGEAPSSTKKNSSPSERARIRRSG